MYISAAHPAQLLAGFLGELCPVGENPASEHLRSKDLEGLFHSVFTQHRHLVWSSPENAEKTVAAAVSLLGGFAAEGTVDIDAPLDVLVTALVEDAPQEQLQHRLGLLQRLLGAVRNQQHCSRVHEAILQIQVDAEECAIQLDAEQLLQWSKEATGKRSTQLLWLGASLCVLADRGSNALQLFVAYVERGAGTEGRARDWIVEYLLEHGSLHDFALMNRVDLGGAAMFQELQCMNTLDTATFRTQYGEKHLETKRLLELEKLPQGQHTLDVMIEALDLDDLSFLQMQCLKADPRRRMVLDSARGVVHLSNLAA